MVAEFDNVVMTRTFSKIYGLAGLRVGWAFCPAAVADVLNRVRGPFNVSTPAQQAAAAALQDRAHVEAAIAHNEKWRGWVTQEIRGLGLRVDDSVANFVLIHFPETKGRTARDADAFLTARGVILRGVESYGLGQCLRMTIGPEEDCRAAVAGLRAFVEAR
jgi:histidinol-phosphate aminotransferase